MRAQTIDPQRPRQSDRKLHGADEIFDIVLVGIFPLIGPLIQKLRPNFVGVGNRFISFTNRFIGQQRAAGNFLRAIDRLGRQIALGLLDGARAEHPLHEFVGLAMVSGHEMLRLTSRSPIVLALVLHEASKFRVIDFGVMPLVHGDVLELADGIELGPGERFLQIGNFYLL